MNRYEQIAYPGYPYPQTHPDRLATLAYLHGMTPAPVEHCQVLELGCGDGANLIPMALQLPASEFLGIDLAASPIQRGRHQVSQLGLKNIRLKEADILNFPPRTGPFDYIIAHGLYSWVPPEVQEKILGIVEDGLAPQGVAFISYNTLPGGYFRLMLRDMMKYHVRNVESPDRQISQGLSLVHLIAEAQLRPNTYGILVGREWEERLSCRSVGALFHDELGEHNTHLYFHEFMARAARHHLQFLAEAEFAEMHPTNFKESAGELLEKLKDDVIARQQYGDFLKGRRFRQTLLCHDSVQLDRNIPPERVMALLIASSAEPSSPVSPATLESPVQFCGKENSSITTGHPLLKTALLALRENWPLPLSFESLWETAQNRLGAWGFASAFNRDSDRIDLMGTLFLCFQGGMVELHSWAPQLALHPGERPTVSPLARLQACQGRAVTTLIHTTVEVPGALERKLLEVLDGTRDCTMILRDLEKAILSGEARLPQIAEPAPDPAIVRRVLSAELGTQLNHLASLGLLLG